MTKILSKIRPRPRFFPVPAAGDRAFAKAMQDSTDFLRRMAEKSDLNAAAREIMTDVLSHSQNTPFLVTIFEAVQEMKSGTDQYPTRHIAGKSVR